ncbi:MAG: VPLPA-CTERM sorting domain-containing protein [Alkalilacustris sp.]
MARILGAAVLAAGVGIGPAALAAPSFLFTFELRVEVLADDPEIVGDVSQLSGQLESVAFPPTETTATSGSGAASVGWTATTHGVPGTFLTLVASGMGTTSPSALGTAESALVFDEVFTVFANGATGVIVPYFVDWTITVEATSGPWGESWAEFTFGDTVLSVDSQSGDGPVQMRGGGSGLFDLPTGSSFAELPISFEGRGAAQTIAPIPLPAGGWLLLLGLGGLVLARWRLG